MRKNKEANFDFSAAIFVDCKPELSRKSVDEKHCNDLKIINPTLIKGWGFDVWYGLNKDSSIDDIKTRAIQISKSLIRNAEPPNDYFTSCAQGILCGFLMYEFIKGNSFIDAINRARSLKIQDYIATILADDSLNKIDPLGKIKSMVSRYEDQENDSFASITNELGKNLDVFDKDSVRYCFDSNPKKATPKDLLNGICISLEIPDYLIDEYSYVFGMIIEICMRYLMSLDEYIQRDPRPIWCLIDEAGSIYVPSCLSILSRGRSKGIQCTLIVQDQKQLRILYGRDQADAIMSCCETQIVLSCTDTELADRFSKRCGQYKEKRTSLNRQGAVSMTTSSSTSSEYRNCWDIADISMLPDLDEALVFHKGKWFSIKKCPYYKIPILSKISERLYAMNKKYEGR